MQSIVSIDDLYRSHGDWLRDLVGRRLRVQPADVEDIVHDTYLRAARERAEAISHPRAFLSQIAFNLFRDRKRREAVRTGHSNVVRLAATPSPRFTDMSEQETALLLERIVADMPELYRDVFALSRFRHMSNRDISAHLGISVKTVEWRMGKALEFCASRLRD